MAIRNDNIELAYQSLFIPVTEFSGVGVIPDSSLTGNAETLELDIVSAGTNDAPLSEVGTTGLVGLEIDTSGSQVKHWMAIPTFMDLSEDIYVRGHWVSASDEPNDTFTVAVTYRQYVDGDTFGAGPTASLNTAIPADNAVGSGSTVYQTTKAGTIDGYSISLDAHDAVEWIVTCTFAADDNGDGVPDGTFNQTKHFLGLEFFYLPKLTPGVQTSKVALPSKVVVAE